MNDKAALEKYSDGVDMAEKLGLNQAFFNYLKQNRSFGELFFS